MWRKTILLGLAALCVAVGPTYADRPIQKRSDAAFIVTGKVAAVYRRETKEDRDYIVEILLEQVHRGAGLRPRNVLLVYCSQRKPDAPDVPNSSGHLRIPREGQRVKAWVNRGWAGRNEGVYPDWMDVLPARKPK